MTKMKHIAIFLVVLFIGLSAIPACTAKRSPQAPALPPGFSEAMVPDLDIDAYIYARQEVPFSLPTRPGFLSQAYEVESVALWLVPSGSDEAVGAVLVLPSQAAALYQEIPSSARIWKHLSGNRIFLVLNPAGTGQALQKAIEGNAFKTLQTRDSKAWEIVNSLPPQPPTKPFAAGFLRLNERTLDYVKKNAAGFNTDAIASLTQQAKIELVGIGAYSRQPINLSELQSVSDIKKLDIGAIAICQSGYPGALLGPALGALYSRLNLTETDVKGGTAYATSVNVAAQKLDIVLGVSGSQIILAGASQLPYAKELLQAALSR